MRRGFVALGLLVVVALPGVGPAHAALIGAPPRNLTLRLVDLAAGYVVDRLPAMCFSDFEDQPTSRAVVRFGRRHLERGCTTRFSQLWANVQDSYGPVEIVGGALVLRSAVGAEKGLKLGDRLVCLVTGVCGPGLRRAQAPTRIGDETVLFDGSPEEWDDAIVIWRSGRLLGFVTVSNLPTNDGTELATALAEKQQTRMSSPTPLKRRDNDDSAVAIENPNLDFDVYWLGKSFEPEDLPGRRLLSSTAWSQSNLGPDWQASLYYGHGDVSLKVWSRSGWRRHKRSKQGRLFLCRRCGKHRSIQLENTRLTLFAIPSECLAGRLVRFHRGPMEARSNRPLTQRCVHRRPDRFVGATQFGDSIVSINLPDCFPCERPNSSPYNSARGVRVLAEGLRLHEPVP